MRCARCRAENPPGARFCGACGAALGTACQACGAALADGQRFCSACGAPAGGRAATADDAERRHATVMFSDLSGYTALNEALDPEEVEALMARIKTEAATIVERAGGTVNQFVGDEIMALFGVPLAHRHDARNAATAALELHHAVDTLVASLTGPARSLRMHTGINAGLVVVRKSDARAGDYVLTGDAVNTAARLRGLAAPGEIVVSDVVWREIADFFDAEPAAAAEVKGKEQPLVAVRIRGARAAPAEGQARLVGRADELGQFRAVAAACAERRRGRVVLVRGDPGVGKSRLVAEFAAVAMTLGFACHTGAVLDFGSETGRDAIRSVARSLFGVGVGAEDEVRQRAIERAASERKLPGEQQLFLHDLLGVAPPPRLRALAAAMSTAARERGSIEALGNLAASAATAAPLLLVVEDIHWADAWTLERLAALAVVASRQPILVVMTTRFAGDPTVGAWRTQLHGAPLLGIDLAPLDTDDAFRLAQLASTVSPELVASCVERAEGNPLFLLQLLLDVGAARPASLPGSIQALVHTRMDRLAGTDKAAMQAAAVLGQRFAIEALRHLLEDETYDCRVLVEQFLVRADGGELMFCHALIRDGAYASLLHKKRRALHTRAGEWFGGRELALAAEHFDRAEDARAAPAYLAAGESLAAQFRHQSALALVERGLELAGDPSNRFALLMARGALFLELGRSADAIDTGRAALAVAATPHERARALIATAAGMRLNDRIAEGIDALAAAEPLATGATLELSRLHHLRGNLLFPLGRATECLAEHELALGFARAGGSVEAEAAALGGLGDAYYLQGRMRSANAQFRTCVALAREHGLGRLEVANLPMIGWTALHLLEIAEAGAIGEEAIDLARKTSQTRAELMARSLLIWTDGVIRDRREPARQQIALALEAAQSLGAKRFEAQTLGASALLALRSGDRTLAREQAERALAICREHGMGHTGPWVLGVCALVESEAATRRERIAEGERELALGCVSHNHVQFRELAIDALLELGAWHEVDAVCERIVVYFAAEPLPTSEFVVARGRALARFGRGERGDAIIAELQTLERRARENELNVLAPALAEALERR
jgi:class 3 adenylate cyclase/tetratricopeptide (TPR) repeat protein